VNSRERSACYPRGSFYPLSDGPSTRGHRITKPDFRLCLTCRSRSQAPLCLYTRRRIANPAEGTFGRLRYLLGGDRPSQTAPLSLSPTRIHGLRLELRLFEGGISPLAPPSPRAGVRRLPPILRRKSQRPRTGYSKAPQGLSVPPREDRIVTVTATSPSSPSRQRSSRYAIHARRNLPDKVLRYHRHLCYLSEPAVPVFTGMTSKAGSRRGLRLLPEPLHLAMEVGPSLSRRYRSGSRVWSLRILSITSGRGGFCAFPFAVGLSEYAI
jgi:hypothetical protein